MTPEAALGGAIGLVQDGDEIRLSVSNKSLELLIDDAEMEQRRLTTPARPARPSRGYGKLYVDHVMQADQGADFDFLMAQE